MARGRRGKRGGETTIVHRGRVAKTSVGQKKKVEPTQSRKQPESTSDAGNRIARKRSSLNVILTLDQFEDWFNKQNQKSSGKFLGNWEITGNQIADGKAADELFNGKAFVRSLLKTCAQFSNATQLWDECFAGIGKRFLLDLMKNLCGSQTNANVVEIVGKQVFSIRTRTKDGDQLRKFVALLMTKFHELVSKDLGEKGKGKGKLSKTIQGWYPKRVDDLFQSGLVEGRLLLPDGFKRELDRIPKYESDGGPIQGPSVPLKRPEVHQKLDAASSVGDDDIEIDEAKIRENPVPKRGILTLSQIQDLMADESIPMKSRIGALRRQQQYQSTLALNLHHVVSNVKRIGDEIQSKYEKARLMSQKEEQVSNLNKRFGQKHGAEKLKVLTVILASLYGRNKKKIITKRKGVKD